MSADADAGHGHDDKKPWWFFAAIGLSVGLGLLLFFELSGQPFARWSAYFATALTNLANGLTASRGGIMMLINIGIAIAAFIWLIKWAAGNAKHDKEIAALQAQLAEAKAKKSKPAATPAPATAAAH